ncbi:MAG: HEAT repeat domain-containing protein [Kofleriaceae bacterium]|nr:HEAT repeat domain-containing protein [Kofleriaceae bacterium]
MLACLAACSSSPRPVAQTVGLPALPPAPSADPTVPGAAYLAALEQRLAPAWQQFLTDCRRKLAVDHPLNAMRLQTQIALTVAGDGKVVRRDTLGSGDASFDAVAEAIVDENLQLPPPPAELRSDDGTVRVEWLFARDRRRATAASARIVIMQVPSNVAVAGMMARHHFSRAASRLLTSADIELGAATVQLSETIIRRALASTDSETVRVAAASIIEDAPGLVPALLTIASAQRGELWPLLYGLADRQLTPVLQQRLLAHVDELAMVLPRIIPATGATWAATLKQLQQRKLWGHALAIQAALDLATTALPDDAVVVRGQASTRGIACYGYVAVAATRRAAWLRVYEALQDGSATVRRDCARALRRAVPAPTSVTKTLRQLLTDPDHQVAAAAVDAMGAQALPVASRIVLELARHPSAAVRAAVARQRAWLQNPANSAALASLRMDRDVGVRGQLVGVPAALPGLLSDPDGTVRTAAARAVTDPALAAPLLNDTLASVRTQAERSQALALGAAAVRTRVLTNIAAAPDGSLAQVQAASVYLAAQRSR